MSSAKIFGEASTVVIITGKTKFDKDDTNALKKAQKAKVKIFAFVIDPKDAHNDLLKQISESSGGAYSEVSAMDIHGQ